MRYPDTEHMTMEHTAMEHASMGYPDKALDVNLVTGSGLGQSRIGMS